MFMGQKVLADENHDKFVHTKSENRITNIVNER